MASQDGFQELVALYDAAGTQVELELRYEQFNRLLGQKATLKSHAASTVRAAYAQVGAGLALRAAVFFQFRVSEEGFVDPAFNLPLEYMAEHAGAGPDLGMGIISMACRSQCPVPWHAINMWEPVGEADAHSAMRLQKAIWRNRLGLKPMPLQQAPARLLQGRRPQEAGAELEESLYGEAGHQQALQQRLTATFGEAGRVSVRQFPRPQEPAPEPPPTGHLREEMARQQQGYLEQIRSCREEIQKLKSALRNEQERNRRLQQLLRGDV
jgi:hypothetical protein